LLLVYKSFVSLQVNLKIKIMRKLILTIAAILFYCITFSQTSLNLEVISSAGDYFAPEGSNITLSWTMGEPVIETFAPQGSTVILTQGFQQPFVLTQPGKFTIDGFILYDNTAGTPLANASIILVNKDNSTNVDKVNTDATGHYLFNNVVNGVYTFLVSTTKTWGGVNVVDALTINRYFVSLIKTFGGDNALRKIVADVDKSTKINVVDALMINRRFVKLIKKFTIIDWQFDSPTVTVTGANVSQNLKALCAGDVNGSYTFSKEQENNVTLQNNRVIAVNPGKEFDYPITLSKDLNLGAFALVFKYQFENIKVKDVISNCPNIVYNITDGEVRVAWADAGISGIALNLNDPIITLKLLVNEVTKENDTQLTLTNESILIDNNSVNLKNEILYAPKITFEIASEGFYLGQNHPNPYKQNTIIDYSLPESAQVSLKVYNLVGEQIGTVMDSWQNSGYHQVSYINPGLAEGVYMYKMEAKGSNSSFIKTRMMVVNQ
jgi:hypothetical protein